MLNRTYILLVVVVFLGLILFFKIFKFIDKNIEVQLIKNKSNIVNVRSPIEPKYSEKFYIDIIDFLNTNTLEHRHLGKIGEKENFFLKMTMNIEILEDGEYTFYVKSDDGFALKIDDKEVLSHIGDRPFRESLVKLNLTKSKKNIQLLYFQGFGNMGLLVEYSFKDSKRYLFGENSEYLNFVKF